MDKLENDGFVDVFRKLNPELKDQYTWWSYRG
jgi:exonuclease III